MVKATVTTAITEEEGNRMIDPKYKAIVEIEGDKKDFEYRGFQCHVWRVNPEYSGHLCGYVEIPANHPVHGMDYDQVEEFYDYELPAHGGLTFASEVENAYWIGFDCPHSGDLCPAYPEGGEVFRWSGDSYKTMGYVEQNIKAIIDFMEERK